MSLVVPCKLIALFGKLPIIFPGKWAIAQKLYRDRREEYISIWQDVGTLSNSLNDEKFKNKSKISLSIAPPMRQDRQKCP